MSISEALLILTGVVFLVISYNAGYRKRESIFIKYEKDDLERQIRNETEEEVKYNIYEELSDYIFDMFQPRCEVGMLVETNDFAVYSLDIDYFSGKVIIVDTENQEAFVENEDRKRGWFPLLFLCEREPEEE